MRIIDALFVVPTEQVRGADQLQPAAEALEFRVVAERVQVQLVAAGEHHAVDLHVLRAERDFARLGRDWCRYLKASSGRLSRSRELEQAARGVDQLTEGLEQRHRLQRGGQRAQKLRSAVTLALARVDRELGAERDRAHAVAAREMK